MIVVVGVPAWRQRSPAGPAGRACSIALVAASRGARTELVGRIGDDPAGDQLVLALSRGGVGHAAVLRDPARPTPVEELVVHPDEDGPTGPGRSPDDGAAPVAVPLGTDVPLLQPEDVRLGLSYLGSYAVLVVADDAPASVLPACVDGAAFAGAHLVVLLPDGGPVPDGIPPEATVLGVPPGAADQALAGLVGAYAAGLDGGHDPAAAFEAALGEPGGAVTGG